MTERELRNKLNAAVQTLQIFHLYEEELREQFGEVEMRRKIDEELDKILYFKQEIKKLKSQNNTDEK